MKFPSAFYLKWLDSNASASRGMQFQLTGKCVLGVRQEKGAYLGLTVFEPKDLTKEFIDRLVGRYQRGGMPKGDVHLCLPSFLKHRWESLQSSLQGVNVATEYTSFVKVKEIGGLFHLTTVLRVMNVDDSPVLLKFLKHHLESVGFIDVVAQVSDSRKAVETIRKFRPDVVTLDIQMPGMTGVDVVRDLLAHEPWPVIMISSLAPDEGSMVFDALNAGAFDYLQKPRLEDSQDFQEQLVEKLLVAVQSENAGKVKNVRSLKVSKSAPPSVGEAFDPRLIWCVGASTGGTQALTQVFTSMPTHIPPTLIVQHIPPVFSKSFADSLNNLVPFTVCEAVDGQKVEADHVYIAPGGFQMGVVDRGGTLYIKMTDDAPVNRFKPSVDYLFREVAKLPRRPMVAGILTGMGKDGSEGLLELKGKGALTFAQDEKSSAVFGMPRAALENGAADSPTALENIAAQMLTLSQKRQAA